MRTFPLLLLLIFFSSCVSVISVKKDSNEKVAGIPFYIQKQVINQETKYLYNWLEITLYEEEVAEKSQPQPIITLRVLSDEAVKQEIAKYNFKENPSKEDLIQLMQTLNSFEQATLNPTDLSAIKLVSNKWAIETIVDYSTKYYLNSKMPWFGTSSLTQKLSANGTLSEATSTVDSQLDELATALSGLATPLASIKVAKIASVSDIDADAKALKDAKAPKGGDKQVEMKYTLKVEEKGHVYTFRKTHDYSGISTNYSPIKFNVDTTNFERTNWPATEVKEDDKPTIKVSGSIQLPDGKKPE
jgi:hypothetical protein